MSWRDDKSFEGLEPEGGGTRGRGAEVRKGGGPGLTFTRNVPKFLQSFQDPVALDHEASLALKRPNPIPDDDDDDDELDDVQKEAIAAYEAAEKEKDKPTEESAGDAPAAKPKRKAPLSFSTTKKDNDVDTKPAKKKRKAVKDTKLLSFDFDD